MSSDTFAPSERSLWLVSRRADFWLACGGASAGLLAALLIVGWHGDRELGWLDFVLAELHLGATYDAVIRRRLWRHRQADVLVVPLVIIALTYALAMSDQTALLTSIAMYTAVWHRGRQSLGVARFYQRAIGGPVSRAHDCLFRGAIYLPMLAGMLTYTQLAPTEYEGEPYFALSVGAEITWTVGLGAALWVIAYFAWTLWRNRGERLGSTSLKKALECFDKLSMNGKYSIISGSAPFALRHSKGERRVSQRPANANQTPRMMVHPGEWWVVLAHVVAFGSGYVLGASHASFLLVLAVHHEVQYLYFTYAVSRPAGFYDRSRTGMEPAINRSGVQSIETRRRFQTELSHATTFAVWPVIGLAGAVAGGWSQLEWLAPLGMGGLFCHYWLDGRIWTRRSFQN